MAKGGARAGAGRKPKPKIDLPAVDKTMAGAILAKSDEEKAWIELLGASDWRLRFDVRKYLTDKRDGKAVQTINHLHDKPIELDIQLSLGERMMTAMAKAEERVKRGS